MPATSTAERKRRYVGPRAPHRRFQFSSEETNACIDMVQGTRNNNRFDDAIGQIRL